MKLSSAKLIVGLLSCFCSLSLPSSYGQSIVYPLNVGNIWVYQEAHVPYPDTARVSRDTVMPNGFTYSVVHGAPINFLNQYQRQVGNQIRTYVASMGAEIVMFDFGRSPGDTLATYIGASDSIDVIFYSSSIITLFGLPRRQWLFGFRRRHIVDADWSYRVTDSIGVTTEEDFWYNYTLTGARLNGRPFGTITSTAVTSEVPPLAAGLHQNYPNPFNPTTIIRYFLPEAITVDLQIRDILGRNVVTLVNERQSAGDHYVQMDARTLSGGMYFYCLQAGNSTLIKKMIVLR